ncbi:MAG TPA: beta-propeller domain-containing protein [Acidimicrobiales bacterium]|nr:beta-propeller domain-containing protein [Acidimicrobiales bacterium]
MRKMGARLAAGIAVGLLAGAATGWGLSGAGGGAGHPEPAVASLVSYEGCSQLLGQARSEALDELTADVHPSASTGPDHGTGLVGLPLASSRPVAVSTPAVENGTDMAAGASGVSATAGSAAMSAAAPAADSTTSGTSGTGGAQSPAFSTTNDQEAGVDEPDLAKTDGNLLVALRQSSDSLEVAAVSGTPTIEGSLDLSSLVEATGLFLVGDDAVVLGSSVSSAASGAGGGGSGPVGVVSGGAGAPGDPVVMPMLQATSGPAVVPVQPAGSDTEVVVVDLSNPAQPSVARSFSMQGTEVDARLIAGVVEVVVSSTPDLGLVAPADGSATSEQAATADDRAAIASSTVSDYLPSVTSEPSGTTTTAPCTSALHTVGDAGLDTIGIVPIDPSSDQPGPEVTVMGDASSVYASTSSLFVAYSPQQFDEPDGTAPDGTGPASDDTVVDAFDLSDPSAPVYTGSGTVPGSLIGQYAMSEYDGDLRVATTVGTPTPAPQDGPAPATLSDNRITVLAQQGGAWVTVGSITGLGTGESIYAVRFEGPLAYVVTFNQTDPLYVVDLSNPTAPQLAGQLPLTGYSSFLEPLGGGLLLGIGQDVNANLQTDGLQVSLFDVSNPADPKLLDTDVIPGASSTAENDAHALLYWAATNLVVMPVDELQEVVPLPQPLAAAAQPATPPGNSSSGDFVGALAWHVTGQTLGQANQISQPPSSSPSPPVTEALGPEIERALVVGDMLYTVSDSGIMASDLATLGAEAWMPYS